MLKSLSSAARRGRELLGVAFHWCKPADLIMADETRLVPGPQVC